MFRFLLIFCLFLCSSQTVSAQSRIIDHSCTDITQLPESAILQAKAHLHIGYGNTSHGGQIPTGMNGLIAFANAGGKGLALPMNIFQWNNGGTGGALDLEEGSSYASGWLERDAGYWPTWYDETREYLDDPSHSDVNIIMWSWCGQLSGKSEAAVISEYLSPMVQLESDYPDVTFVYMTGHADGTGLTGNLHLRNQQIRNFCIANDKWLYDYYDIECYDPDGSYFGDKNVNDDCSYSGGNWAVEWRAAHTENVDWYNCTAAHTDVLNANQKAYAAWWLFARLAGWQGNTSVDAGSTGPEGFVLHANYPNPFNPSTTIHFHLDRSYSIGLFVYDMRGRQVRQLQSGRVQAGVTETQWDGRDDAGRQVSSGIYLLQLRCGQTVRTQKMTLLR